MEMETRRLAIDKGFTLTEVLVAMIVIAIAFIGISQMQLSSISSNIFANNLSIATTLVQDKMEEIKATNYDNITTTNFPNEDYGEINNGDPQFSMFSREITIEDLGDRKLVIVTVSWKEGFRTKSVSLTTAIAP